MLEGSGEGIKYTPAVENVSVLSSDTRQGYKPVVAEVSSQEDAAQAARRSKKLGIPTAIIDKTQTGDGPPVAGEAPPPRVKVLNKLKTSK
jgi:hypothetical protein